MLDTIFERRSIRKYTDRPVEEDKLHTLLRAAMYAPSAKDARPWHFVVVHDRGVIEQFMQVHPYSKMLEQAPVLIVVCGDKSREAAPGTAEPPRKICCWRPASWGWEPAGWAFRRSGNGWSQ